MLESLVARWGYVAIFAGTFLEGETVLLAGGAMAHRGLLSLPWVIACAFVASFAGDQMWFFLGRRYGPRAIERRPGWAAPAERVRGWLRRFGTGFVLAFRFVYGIRVLTPVLLGASGYPASRFAPLNAAAAAVWSLRRCGPRRGPRLAPYECMKRTLKIGGRLALVGAGLGLSYWQLQGRFNPQARYQVERKQGDFEIRIYEPAVRAETAIVSTDWNEALETGFERLAYYIHQGNSEGERIAMTGPVTQSAERVAVATPVVHRAPALPDGNMANGALPNGKLDEHEPPATAPRTVERALATVDHGHGVPSWIMSFAMPAGRHLHELPVPDDPRVRLRPMSERRVAVLRFSGRYTPLRVGDRARELIHRVHREGLDPRGPVEFAAYDPPTTLPFLRRNEVRVDLAA